MEEPPSERTIARALRLLASQKAASKKYYEANKDVINERSKAYWEEHRENINTRRRERYLAKHPKIVIPQE